jgi:hypothetical protein
MAADLTIFDGALDTPEHIVKHKVFYDHRRQSRGLRRADGRAARMNQSIGLLALLMLAILSIVGVVAITRPVRIEENNHLKPIESAATASSDAGSLDSLFDAIHVDHQMKHGR